MTLLLHRAGNVSCSSQAYKLQHTDADTPTQLTASHASIPAAVPAASPEDDTDSSGHDAALSDATVTAGIIVASAACVPQVSSKCVVDCAVFPCAFFPCVTLACLLMIISFCKINQSILFCGGPSTYTSAVPGCSCLCQVDSVKIMLWESDCILPYALFQGGA